MDSTLSPLQKLSNFVPIDDSFGYTKDVEEAYQALRQFETITTTRFSSFYSKYFGKQGR